MEAALLSGLRCLYKDKREGRGPKPERAAGPRGEGNRQWQCCTADAEIRGGT